MTTTHGGKRAGAGRNKKEETKLVRVPLSKIEIVQAIREPDYHHTIPLYSGQVAAGYPTPTDDNVDEYINLQQYLVKRPDKTFMVRASGDSMINAGINSGDLLIVDTSEPVSDGKMVIAVLNGELTVKFFSLRANQVQLLPANPNFFPITITEEVAFSLCGVVTHIIHQT